MTQQTADRTRSVTVTCQYCITLNRVDVSRLEARPKCGQCAKPILLDRPVKVTDEDFTQVVRDADIPVLVDFYADWCAPCRLMTPILEEFAQAQKGKILVVKLNTDKSLETAQHYEINSIPTLILFRNGVEVERKSGMAPIESLEGLVNSSGH